MFHQMSELGDTPVLVRSTDLTIKPATPPPIPGRADPAGVGHPDRVDHRRGGGYTTKQLPPLQLGYSRLAVDDTLHTLTGADAANITGPFDGTPSDGLISTVRGCKESSPRTTTPGTTNTTSAPGTPPAGPRAPASTPSWLATKPSLGALTLTDLNGDGNLCAVNFAQPSPGWFEYDADTGWSPLRLLSTTINVDFNDPNLRFVDLNGDGLPTC